MTIKESVLDRISILLHIPKNKLTEDTVLAEIVEDSLMYFELFLELERAIGKNMSFEEALSITTIGDVVSCIEQSNAHH